MLTASSIRYGGMLVDAAECNYTSFKHLGLLCPICKRTVFLVREKLRPASTRKNKDGSVSAVKEANVCSYFAHHSDVDRDTINDCELRSSQITLGQRLAAETISRNQRQKIMQAHLWKITRTSLLLHELEIYEQIFSSMWMNVCVYTDKRKEFALNELVKFVTNYLSSVRGEQLDICINNTVNIVMEQSKEIHKTISKLQIEKIKKEARGMGLNELDADFSERILTHSISLVNSVDIQMHSQIISEVIAFITQKRQCFILNKLVLIAMHMATNRRTILIAGENGVTITTESYTTNYKSLVRMLIGCDESILISFAIDTVDHLIMILAEVNWAEQFEALENKELVYSYQGEGFGKK